MTVLTKTILAAVGVWFVLLIVVFVVPDFLPLILGFNVLFSLPIALVFLVLTLFALIREKRKLGPVLGLILIVTVSYVGYGRITYWGARVCLYLNKGSYERTAQRMLTARDSAEQQRICGERCWLLTPNRGPVGFHYVHGFLNWTDIIYDPSGSVAALKSWDEKKQFNMYFIKAEPLMGDWYLVYFAD